jgi:hypothetical protein
VSLGAGSVVIIRRLLASKAAGSWLLLGFFLVMILLNLPVTSMAVHFFN